MTEKILCVDDEPNLLHGIKRQLRNQFDLDVAVGPREALSMLAERGPYAVVLSDMRMPDMNGVELLIEVGRLSSNTTRLMLTGNADQKTVIDAVNRGHVFRFLCKPCTSEELSAALQAGIEQYRLVTAEKELLSKTLAGSMSLLTDLLALVNPTAFGQATRLRQLARTLLPYLPGAIAWEIEIAALASQIGRLAVPESVLLKVQQGELLSPDESEMLRRFPQIGADLLKRIPRLENIAKIVAMQQVRYASPGGDGVECHSDLPLGARVLKACVDYDALRTAGIEHEKALQALFDREGWYDPEVLTALSLAAGRCYEIADVCLKDLNDEMTLAEHIFTHDGDVLVARDQPITPLLRERLKNFALSGRRVREPLRVRRPLAVEQPVHCG